MYLGRCCCSGCYSWLLCHRPAPPPPPLSCVLRRLTHCPGQWTGQRELTVTVGLDPAVAVAANGTSPCTNGAESCITLAEGGVRSEAFAVLFSVGSTALSAPDEPPAVSAALFAPQVMMMMTRTLFQ